MSPANDPSHVSVLSPEVATGELNEFADAHPDWLISYGGHVPLEINRTEFDFSAAHGRLVFSSWTEQGSRTWHITDWNRADEKLVLKASRRMGAEVTTIELVPRASAKALVASIAAARQARCEKMAQLVAEGVAAGRVLGVATPDLNRREANIDSLPIKTPHAEGVGGGVLGVATSDPNKHGADEDSLRVKTPQAEGVGGRVLGVATSDPNRREADEDLLPIKTPHSPEGPADELSSMVNRKEAPSQSRNEPNFVPSLPPLAKERRVNQDELHPKPYTQYPPSSVKIERATLSPGMRRDQPGRYARIILQLPRERIAVTGVVAQSDPRNVDSLFSSALLWFARLQASPRRPPLNRLLIVTERNILESARQRHVLLRDSLRDRLALVEIDDDWKQIEPTPPWERRYIWRKRLPRFPPVIDAPAADGVNQIVGMAPEAIDVVASRQGQTLRYHGLPFARVRRVMERETVWFGIEGAPRRLLGAYQQREFAKLLDDLRTYRNENCRDHRHWFYRAAGEAWLESILRRDISKLDPGLIVAPLHAQFRTSPGGPTGPRPVDLLALRHDGRLVVIELKVSEDREHLFQGVDYWRRVEAHRRRGHISSAKLFGEREISDESPLVYLVAPTLRFHPSFATLARTIAPDIEIYRFDVNEDWRRGVRVVRRERVNP